MCGLGQLGQERSGLPYVTTLSGVLHDWSAHQAAFVTQARQWATTGAEVREWERGHNQRDVRWRFARLTYGTRRQASGDSPYMDLSRLGRRWGERTGTGMRPYMRAVVEASMGLCP